MLVVVHVQAAITHDDSSIYKQLPVPDASLHTVLVNNSSLTVVHETCKLGIQRLSVVHVFLFLFSSCSLICPGHSFMEHARHAGERHVIL